MRNRFAPRVLSATAGVLLACTVVAWAEDRELGESIASRMKEIFASSRTAVVKIQSSDQHGRIEGTGFFADPSGTIYTVVDVLGDGKDVTVCQGARKLPANVVAVDPRTGIAILKVEAATPFIPIGDSSKLEVSSPLVVVGFPMDHPAAPTFGLVTSFEKEYLNRYFRTTHVRANIPVQPGLGGAPALNFKGEAVGIVVAGVDGNTGCFILPINAAEKLRSDLANFGRLRPGWVGVSVEPASDDQLPSTARVAELEPFAPANRAGVKQGDVLLRVGDVAITKPEDIFDASFFLTAGMDTTIKVLRDGQEMSFTVRAGDNPTVANAFDRFQPNGQAAPPTDLSALTLETAVAPQTPAP